MTLAVLTAVGVGVGLCGLVRSVRPRRPSLAMIVRDLSARESSASLEPARPSPSWRMDHRLGWQFAASMRRLGRPRRDLTILLSLTDKSFDELCCQAVLGGMAGLALPLVSWGLLTAGGVRLPVFVPLWGALALAGAGSILPLFVLRSEAKGARRAARRAVGAFLDLVVLSMAGGMGVEGALLAAPEVSGNRTSRRIASALAVARDAGETPWDALARLGMEFGIAELTELAAAVSLAGNEGARIRSTLAAKAGSIRRHELAEMEADANAVTERLFLPGVFLLVGFLVFIGYPAYARIAAGF